MTKQQERERKAVERKEDRLARVIVNRLRIVKKNLDAISRKAENGTLGPKDRTIGYPFPMRDGVSGVHRRTPGINDYDEARRLHEATLNYIVGYFDSKGIPIEVDRHLNQVYIPNPNSESLEQTRGR